jgi:hypothetical protein
LGFVADLRCEWNTRRLAWCFNIFGDLRALCDRKRTRHRSCRQRSLDALQRSQSSAEPDQE